MSRLQDFTFSVVWGRLGTFRGRLGLFALFEWGRLRFFISEEHVLWYFLRESTPLLQGTSRLVCTLCMGRLRCLRVDSASLSPKKPFSGKPWESRLRYLGDDSGSLLFTCGDDSAYGGDVSRISLENCLSAATERVDSATERVDSANAGTTRQVSGTSPSVPVLPVCARDVSETIRRRLGCPWSVFFNSKYSSINS